MIRFDLTGCAKITDASVIKSGNCYLLNIWDCPNVSTSFIEEI